MYYTGHYLNVGKKIIQQLPIIIIIIIYNNINNNMLDHHLFFYRIYLKYMDVILKNEIIMVYYDIVCFIDFNLCNLTL